VEVFLSRDGSGGPVQGEAGLSALSFRFVLSLVAQTRLNMSAHIITVYGLYFNYCSDCHVLCI